METLARLAITLVLAAPVAFFASEARAGGCPACTKSSDCGGGFCVLWDQSPGCGTLLQTCCPGQACALDNGCPSCLANGDCVVVDGPPTCPQATTSTTGAGTASTGSGTTSSSGANASAGSGTPSTGAGAGGADGGDSESGGCSCRTSEHGLDGGAAMAAALGGIGLFARRKRRG